MMEQAAATRNATSFGSFRMDASRRLLVKDGTELGARTLDVVIELVSRPNEVGSKNDLLARVCPDVSVDEASFRFHIVDLRKAFGCAKDGARYIATLKARGYCLVAGNGVEEIGAAARFPHAKLPPRLIGIFGRERADGANE
jgi:DNA-binding winged helix-turn-helix (wHTH) protein